MKPLLIASLLAVSGAAHAHLIVYEGSFMPEVANATGTGQLRLEYDEHGNTLFIQATWSGLSGAPTNAHIHCCTPVANVVGIGVGVALAQSGRLPGFPTTGPLAGGYTHTVDLGKTDQYAGAFVTAGSGTADGARDLLLARLASGNAYFNIHTSTFPRGEIRAFVTQVPEPHTYALMLGGLLAVSATVSRRRKAG